jgi:hypothetical protein
VSGLETAIRNALERSDRGDPDIRARIYQSARQALEAGLRKQSVTDPQVILAQRQKLEDKIQEIEIQERVRQRDAQDHAPDLDIDTPPEAVEDGHPTEEVMLGGQTKEEVATTSSEAGAPQADLGDLGTMRPERSSERLQPVAEPVAPKQTKRQKKAAAKAVAAAEGPAPQVPGEKRSRRRRGGLISSMFSTATLLIFLGLGGWWLYSSGMLQPPQKGQASVPKPPVQARGEETRSEQTTAFDPQRGFSSDWKEIFVAGGKTTAAAPGRDASADPVAMADGTALRITSRAPGVTGDVGIEVPVDILRQLAGKTSTIALTLQSASDNSVQLAVRCDFSSLGGCSRHRVMATQERGDTLFRVTFDRTLAPNQPGRIYINSDVLGGSQPAYLFSVRILPGQ